MYQSELNRDVIIIKTIGKVERASEMGTTVPDRQEKKRDNERPISNWILFVFDSVYLRKLLSVVIVVKKQFHCFEQAVVVVIVAACAEVRELFPSPAICKHTQIQ